MIIGSKYRSAISPSDLNDTEEMFAADGWRLDERYFAYDTVQGVWTVYRIDAGGTRVVVATSRNDGWVRP